MNWPNRLTVMRMVLVPVVMLLILPVPLEFLQSWNQFISSQSGHIIALIVFCVASFSDFLDGYLARKHNQITTIGKFLDPIADKMLVLAVFAAYVQLGRLSAWVLLIVLMREFAVTGIRLLAVEKGKVIAAGNLGKLKTVTQMTALILLLLEAMLLQYFAWFSSICDIFVVISVVLTLISGIQYLHQNREIFRFEQSKG